MSHHELVYQRLESGAPLSGSGKDGAVQATHIFEVKHRVDREFRWTMNGHRGGALWLTGLSGSGKSTLAMNLELALGRRGFLVYVLDGDNVRGGLNRDLGFSPEDRAENIRRLGEVAALFADAGFIVITAFISPYRADRDQARDLIPDNFHEVHVRAGLAECESRDPKGLYKKARAGEIPAFTGVSAPYQAPENPELVVDTGAKPVGVCVSELVAYVEEHFQTPDNLARIA